MITEVTGDTGYWRTTTLLLTPSAAAAAEQYVAGALCTSSSCTDKHSMSVSDIASYQLCISDTVSWVSIYLPQRQSARRGNAHQCWHPMSCLCVWCSRVNGNSNNKTAAGLLAVEVSNVTSLTASTPTRGKWWWRHDNCVIVVRMCRYWNSTKRVDHIPQQNADTFFQHYNSILPDTVGRYEYLTLMSRNKIVYIT